MRMKVIGVIEKGQDGTYDIRMSHHKLDFFLLGQGDTVELAKEDFLVSDEEMRDLHKEEKNAYPNLEFVYKFDLPSFLTPMSLFKRFLCFLDNLMAHRETGQSQCQR